MNNMTGRIRTELYEKVKTMTIHETNNKAVNGVWDKVRSEVYSNVYDKVNNEIHDNIMEDRYE